MIRTLSKTHSVLAAGLWLVACVLLPADSTSGAPVLSKDDRELVIRRIAEMIEEKYARPEVGRDIAEDVRRAQAGGKFSDIETPAELASRLTDLLKPFDLHFAVKWRPVTSEEKSGTEITPPDAGRSNYGFDEFRLLAGNVAYLNISSFALIELEDPQDPARRAAEAAMAMLAHADAVIIDIRECGGGTPEMVELVLSYFFDERPRSLNELFWGPDGKTYEFATLKEVVGTRKPTTPLFVLTSARTASAAEEFAYDVQVLERGLIVGERTLGAANPGSSYQVGHGFTVFISVGLVKNAVTGTNWGGVGIRPDLATDYAGALGAAHEAAVRTLLGSGPAPGTETALGWILERFTAEKNPVAVGRRALHSLVGTYGTRRIDSNGGHLEYRRSERLPRRRLIPIRKDVFAIDGFDGLRLDFERDERGRVVALVEKTAAGGSARHARK